MHCIRWLHHFFEDFTRFPADPPSDIKRQLEDMLEGGSMSGAIVGLVKYALDELQSNGKRIVIQLPAK